MLRNRFPNSLRRRRLPRIRNNNTTALVTNAFDEALASVRKRSRREHL
jgi:hypothetical protein